MIGFHDLLRQKPYTPVHIIGTKFNLSHYLMIQSTYLGMVMKMMVLDAMSHVVAVPSHS
jgi:hypothetical protein